jgi:translation elongation factor P/translation initiation factor 5A
MKSNILNWAGPALLSAGVLAFTSCSSTPSGEETTGVVYQQGVPGGVVVQTYKETATVTAIDPADRKVTLVSSDGKKDTVKCGPDVVNFDQIRVGDQLKVTVTEQLAVAMAQAGAPPSDGGTAVVALAPVGAKPGGVVANTMQVTAKVSAIDLKHHKATLQFPDGTTKTFAVRKDVDLTQRQVGEEVSIRVTEALAISVEKP